MLERKHTLNFVLFLLGSTSLILFSFTGSWDGGVFKEVDSVSEKPKSLQESYFKKVLYHVNNEKGPLFMLDASELTLNNTIEKTFFFDPRGFAFTETGERVEYAGKKGVYDQKGEVLNLERETFLKTDTTEATADKMIYSVTENRVHMIDQVKTKTFYVEEGDWIYLDADEAFFWTQDKRSKYAGNVDGKIKRKRVYEDSMEFKSNELYLNMESLKADLHRDVWMKKQQLTATSRRGEIFLENYNKKLKYFALYDDVKVVEKVMLDGKLTNRKAFSEKLEGIPSEGKIILTGYPKVYQLNDVIKGNMIVLRENTEVVEVDDANTKFNVE